MESMEMIDPVDVDLNRHLAEVERAEARGEAEDAKVEEWMTDRTQVRKALEELVQEDLKDFIEHVVEAICNTNPDMQRKAESRAIGWFEDGVRQKFEEWAPAAVEKDERKAELEHGEYLAEQEEARKAGY